MARVHNGSGWAAEQQAGPWISIEKGLRHRLRPDFDDYCFPMDDRVHDGSGWTAEQQAGPWISMEKGLRRRLRPDFDDYCFPMARQARDDRMHDCSGWAAEQLAGPRKTQMMAKPLSRVSIFLQD